MRYQVCTPKGFMDAIFEADSDEQAEAKVEAGGDTVLDMQSSLDEDGKLVILLVVADEG